MDAKEPEDDLWLEDEIQQIVNAYGSESIREPMFRLIRYARRLEREKIRNEYKNLP